MKKILVRFFILAVLATSLVACVGKNGTINVQKASQFVTIEDGHFVKNGNPYYFVGANFWYGAILASTGEGGDRERLSLELDSLQAIGVDNLRILVGGDGENGLPSRIRPTLQMKPGIYNDTILDGLDYLIAELERRDMKAVLYLNNAWEWSGGYSVYLQWAGYGKAPIPAVDGWPAYMEYVAQYMKSPEAQGLFAAHVKLILSRFNVYTGRPYTEEPAIMSWQVANEPRCFADDNKEAFVLWTDTVTALIRSIDTNHLISIGSEGKHGCEQDIELYEKIHQNRNVDYLNIHIWPYNWGWASEQTLAESLDDAKTKTIAYIEEHKALAEKYSKPIVLEEFGYPRDGFRFSRESTTTSRDEYYGFVFDYLVEQAAQRGLFAGCNFWAWGGSAKPSAEHEYWQQGDPYTGDPAQEQQGLNSVFNTDSTMNVIRTANRRLQEIVK
ncbi:MAG: cellulase family glycosylhydrolase [Marinilabiliaceae bacterium]|nr:cellulase family glycosylhydrolase [Marinilabiliaceae bacterium]